MLGTSDVIAFVATTDAARAKDFYGNVLGLRLVAEEPVALVFDANGTMLRVTPVRLLTPPPYTVLGWTVADIRVAVAALGGRGVSFERFEGFGQDEDGVWSAPDGTKVAWFKDPDGNMLSLTEFA